LSKEYNQSQTNMVEIEVAKLKEKMESEAAKRCHIMVKIEVAKSKAKMEIENAALYKEIEIGQIN
jgi:hypothetical protein